MQHVFEHLVLIVAGKADGPAWLGTGTLIAPNRVLTAAHVLSDEQGRPFTRLGVVFRGEREPIAAFVEWVGEKNVDVAVLSLKSDPERKPARSALLVLSADEVATRTSWEAQGYPRVRDDERSRRVEKVKGSACSYRKSESRLELDIDVAPKILKGLSGGPIVIRDRIAGIARAVPNDWDGRRLEATPVAVFLDNLAFRAAIGVTGEDERYANDLETLKREIVSELEKAYDLCQALAECLKCNKASAIEIVEAMVHTPACTWAQTLVDLDVTLAQESQRIQLLLWRTLPFCVDWQAVLLAARRSVAEGKNAVDCPLHSETIAEVILAGMDGRSCDFVLGQGDPRGTAQLNTPVEAYSPLFFNSNEGGQRLVDAVVGHWFKEQEPLLKSYSGRQTPRPDDPKMRVWIKAQLANFARPNNPKRHSRYVVFRDEDWTGERGQMDTLWEVACVAFKEQFPSLHLVRLRGGVDAYEKEVDIIVQIRDYLERPRTRG